MTGWIKVHRSLWKKGWSKKPEYVAIWLYLLKEATHEPIEHFWNGKTIKLMPGQFITGRLKIAENTGVHESNVERVLKRFQNEQQIEQQKTSTSRLISIINYTKFQQGEQPFEQQTNNERTTSEQPMNTKQEHKNIISKVSKPFFVSTNPLCVWISTSLSNVCKMKNQLTDKQASDLIDKYGKALVYEILQAMENKADLSKKYTSVNLTIQSWIRMRKGRETPQPVKPKEYDKETDIYSGFSG